MTRVKICCISSVQEARLAVRLGADAVGLVSRMPSGPGVVSEDLIAMIAAQVPPPIATFLLTSETKAAAIIAQQARCGTNTIQLCDRVESRVHAEIREALPGVRVVQVVHVNGDDSVDEALGVAGSVDALLLDSGNQNLDVKELGGTGRVHDWRLSERIVLSAPVPVFLAGGLGPINVAGAIRSVRPFGVDICSGVRTGGKLDRNVLSSFMEAVRTVA